VVAGFAITDCAAAGWLGGGVDTAPLLRLGCVVLLLFLFGGEVRMNNHTMNQPCKL